MTMTQWMPVTWLDSDHNQPAAYPWDSPVLRATLSQITAPQSIVTPASVSALQQQLVDAYHGKKVILQAGVCTEQFADACADVVASRLRQLHGLAECLQALVQQPIVSIGRLCGQYAKPRSSATETRGAVTLPSYYGDLVNASDFTASGRSFDCQPMVAAVAATKASWKQIEYWQHAHP